MSEATAAFGTLIKIGNGGTPEVFTAIAEVKDLSGPEISVDAEETTHHQSEGAFEEMVATIIRTGEITFDVNWLPQNATHSYSTGIFKDLINRTKRNFQIVWSDVGTTTWLIPAIIKSLGPNAAVTGVLGASISLKPTGKPTFA